jgi:hypothetical protein
MEIDRVRAIKQLEEREHALQETRTKRAAEIKAQILDRQQQRLIDHELKDQETQVCQPSIRLFCFSFLVRIPPSSTSSACTDCVLPRLQVMLAQLERMQEEDKQAMIRKKERSRMLLTEANKFNEMNQSLKKQQEELSKLESVKAMEFLKAKAEREEAQHQEEQRKKRERAVELAKLLSMQESALDEV